MQNLKAILKDAKDFLLDKNKREKYLKILFKSFAILLVVGCMITVLVRIMILIRNNWETIVVVVGSIGSVSLLILGFFPKKKPNSEMQSTSTSYLQYDPITLENTYKLL